mgnify:CR=1 FL=1
MKKFNILICILMVLFTLTACGGTEEVAEDTTTTAPTTVTTTLPISTTDEATETVTTIESTTKTTTIIATTSVTTTESTTIYTTTKATTTKPTTTTVPTTQTTTETKDYCTVKIECTTIYDNLPKLKSGKQSFLPTSGVIIDDEKVELNGGESAFDVIKKTCEENVCTDNCKYCKANGVQIEYTYTPAFNNYYIEGIHQIYEKDCGTQSGWMYSVNGEFPDEGSSSYIVSPGDMIVFSFTCNMGEDIGNLY